MSLGRISMAFETTLTLYGATFEPDSCHQRFGKKKEQFKSRFQEVDPNSWKNGGHYVRDGVSAQKGCQQSANFSEISQIFLILAWQGASLRLNRW